MKFLKYLWHFVKNILWALIIVIVYFLLIWIIKTWWVVNYFFYLNSRDWIVISKQINFLEPHTLTHIFYSYEEISGSMAPDWRALNKNNLTWSLTDSGNVLLGTWTIVGESWLNAYDPEFESDFNNNLEWQFSWANQWSWSFWFVNTWS